MFEKIGVCVAVLALILNIVGVAIPYWFYTSVNVNDVSGSFKFGLWKVCNSIQENGKEDHGTICLSYDVVFSDIGEALPLHDIKATRGLEILAILAITAAGALACLQIFLRKDDKRLLFIAAITAFIAGLFMIIGAVVFVADNSFKEFVEQTGGKSNLKPHAGFALCVVSGVLSLVAGGLYFVAAKRNIDISSQHKVGPSCVATPYWFYASVNEKDVSGTLNFGLWKVCTGVTLSPESDAVSICVSYDDYEVEEALSLHEIKAARGLEILAVLAITVSGVLACLQIFWRKDDKRLLFTAAITALIAGLLMIIGAVVFVADNSFKEFIERRSAGTINLKPHVGFALCVVSGVLSLVTGGLYFVAAKRSIR